jgi:DNA-binding NtrC family response regulator
MRDVLATAEKVLPTDASVLILGESGVGKDYLAEALHGCGPRQARPFVRIDCSSLPEELFEAELFGYEKGAFTDAATRKLGRIEMAEGGTLYLDEIGSLAPHLQAKLLRVLQDGQFSRLGDNRTVTVDVRVISSSNLAPHELADENRLRKDLFFRLNVVSLRLPPLRDRNEDLAAMARVFLRDAARRLGRPARELDPAALRVLRDHTWPGNLRELRNAMERAAILTNAARIGPDALPTERFLGGEGLLVRASEERWTLEELERRYIQEILRQMSSNQSRAAAILGISRKTLLEKRKKWGL